MTITRDTLTNSQPTPEDEPPQPEGKGEEETPPGLDSLTSSPVAPELEEQSKSPDGSAKLYLKELQNDVEIHSHIGLEYSRAHCIQLLNLLPEYNKTEMAVKCTVQEINLQESIRKRSYDDAVIFAKARSFLAFLVGFGSFLFAFVAYIWFFFHPDLKEQGQTLLDFAKWMMGTALVTVLYFYFPQKLNRSKK